MGRSSRWNQNPPIQPRINWGNPVTKGLRACYIFNTHPGAIRNLVRPDDGALTITGSPTLSPSSYNARGGRYAPGLLFGGSDMITIPITNKWGIPSMGSGGAFSYHLVFDASANGAVFGAFGHFSVSYDPTASWQGLSFVGNTWESGTNSWSTGKGDAPTNPTQMFHSFPGNAMTRIGWVDRTRLTNSDYRSHTTSSNNNLYIGGNWTGTASFQGRIYSLMVWEGAVHENIYSNHLFENPYCVLERNPRRTYSIPSGGTLYTKDLTETLTLSDVVNKSIGRNLVETLTLTDLTAKQTGKPLSEVVNLSDSILKSPSKVLTELVSLNDSLVRQVQKILTESVSVSDVMDISLVYVKTLTEVLTLSDTLTRSTSKLLSETLTLSDQKSIVISKVLSETIGLTDSLLTSLLKILELSETITLSDVLQKGSFKAFLETVNISDAIQKMTVRELLETLSLSDELTRSLGSLIEQIQWLSEAVTRPSFSGEDIAFGSFSSEDVTRPEFYNESVLI